jgi:AcrR family transcriptional regulator
MELMATKSQRAPRRSEALSRDVIVEAATEILDAGGEDALTLRALTVRLATGYGAIYHHVADRNDLLAAATDHVIARIVTNLDVGAGPRQALRAVALGLFDAIDAHPWVGAQLTREPWRPALLDIYESISGQLRVLRVPERALSDSAGVLVNYILGVAGQNAANARALASSQLDRSAFLATVAAQWAQLDPARYPNVHRASTQLHEHDDRGQFLAGIDLILVGIETVHRAGRDRLEAMMTTSDFEKTFVERIHEQGISEGEVRGKAEGKAESVLRLLDARHLTPSEDQRQRVTSCTDSAQLDRWFDRAVTASTAAEVFGD